MARTDSQNQTSTERVKLLVDAIQDYGIFMLDPKGIVVTWNRGAENIKGYRAEEVVGQHFSIFYPEDDRAAKWPDKELRLALARGKYEEEGWRVRKDGTRFWASVVITPLIDDSGTLTGFGKVTRDLTERKELAEAARQSEHILRQSERRFRLLMDGVRDYAIYMLDAEGHVQSWNKGAQLIKGYSAEEVIGKHYSMFFRQEDRVEGLPAWQLQRALLHGRIEEEGWRIRKNGSSFWANIVITPIVEADGKLIGYAKVTRDMSDRAKLHELEHSLERMNEFLAMLGHELRNPLASMQYAVALMERESALNTTMATSRDILGRQLAHLTRLMDELLDAGRLTSGKIHIKPQQIAFKNVVKQAVEAVWPGVKAHGHVLDIDLPKGDIWVNADEVRLTQVLHNLLSNAIKFTPDGGSIGIRATVVNARLIVDISDNGAGMDAAAIDKLFVLFAQGKGPKGAQHGGLGIGLALARSLVEMHGGTITAASSGVGKGSVITFELPGAAIRNSPSAAD